MAGDEVKSSSSGAFSIDLVINTILLLALVGVLAWKFLSDPKSSSKRKTPNPSRQAAGGADGVHTSTDAGGANKGDADFLDVDEMDDIGPDEDLEPLSEHEIGEEFEYPLADLHFGLPRCKVRAPGLENLPTIIKWKPEQFDAERLDCARVSLSTFRVWVVQGMKSNRLLYAMKKHGLETANCSVVETPPSREDDENFPDTYGTDIAKIQLVP